MDVSIEHLDAHFVASMAVLAEHAAETGVVARRDHVAVTAVGRGPAAFNTAWVTGLPDDPLGALSWARDVLTATGPPFTIQVAAPWLPGVSEAAATVGLEAEDITPGMVRSATREVPPLADGLRVEAVRTPDTLHTHAVTAAIGFGVEDPDAAVRVLPVSLLDDDKVALFNGHVDGRSEPSATAVCVVAEGIAGVYAVTVHEHARRRGIGAAMTWAAVAAGARAGIEMAALQATPMGLPLYTRMGFRPVADYHRLAVTG